MRLSFILLAAAASMALVFTAHAHEYKVGTLFIHHPAVNATPPGAENAVGYFEIRNNGDADDTLESIEAPTLARLIEIHKMSSGADGRMTMRKYGPVIIPPHEEIDFKPDGLHVMFMNLNGPVKDGEKYEATLHFKKAGDVKVYFAGSPIGASPGADDAHGDMPGMDMKDHQH